MELHSNTVRERIYNIVVDDFTNTLRKKGFKVLISEAYPDEGEPKYIIWVNVEQKTAYRFIWFRTEDYFQMGSSRYNKAMEPNNMRWDVIAVYHCHEQDIPEEDIPNITSMFLGSNGNTENSRPSVGNLAKSIPGVTGSGAIFKNKTLYTGTDDIYQERKNVNQPVLDERKLEHRIYKYLKENRKFAFALLAMLIFLLRQCARLTE